jgi:hypothetical protein
MKNIFRDKREILAGHSSNKMTVDLYGHFKAVDVKRVSPYSF